MNGNAKLLILIVALLLSGSVSSFSQEPPASSAAGDISSEDTLGRAEEDSAGLEKSSGRILIAYYFHTTRRCMSCRKIEAYSGEAINAGFADQVKSGRIEWRPVNTDLAENRHFIDDYQLYTKSLIIADMENGRQLRWKNLQKVWELLKDKQEFQSYVQKEINDFLEDN